MFLFDSMRNAGCRVMQYLTGKKVRSSFLVDVLFFSLNLKPGISILQQTIKYKDPGLQGLALGMHQQKACNPKRYGYHREL